MMFTKNGGIEAGILKAVKEDSDGKLPKKDAERLKELDSLPKNKYTVLDTNGKPLSDSEALKQLKSKYKRFKFVKNRN